MCGTQSIIHGEDWDSEGVGPHSCVVLVTIGTHGYKATSMDVHDHDTFLLQSLLTIFRRLRNILRIFFVRSILRTKVTCSHRRSILPHFGNTRFQMVSLFTVSLRSHVNTGAIFYDIGCLHLVEIFREQFWWVYPDSNMFFIVIHFGGMVQKWSSFELA